MGESHRQPTSRLGLKSTGGEIIEVQGGHIVRATGRKDRHSKVCTAKGPRDRRVRLSANTAIQFYDVQDRLGYDRPSKAVDWLIKKAKSAIDDLAQLPPWHPTATAIVNTVQTEQQGQEEEENQHRFKHHRQHMSENDNTVVGSDKRPMETEPEASGYVFQHHQQQLNNSNSNNNNNAANSSSFHPLSLDSDAFADTMKSFFPMVAPTSSSSIHFQNYPPDLLSRTSSQTQDLRLSLQSFQDPILLHHHHHHHNSHQHSNTSNTPTPSAEQALLAFDSNSGSWSEQQQQMEMGRFQRMVAWNAGTDAASGGFLFHSPSPALQPLFGQNSLFSSQRGPLQSSNSPSVRAWTDPPIAATTYHHHQTPAVHPSSISGIGFASGGFSGFHIPARIQGEEEQDDDVSNKPSSASSASRH